MRRGSGFRRVAASREVAKRANGCRRLQVESLEDRRLLAAMTALPEVAFDASLHRASSLIVQFRDGTSFPGSLAAHLSTAKVNEEWSIAPGMRRVDLDPAADWAATLLAYKNDPNVLFAQPDHRVSLQLEPDDPQYPGLYGLNNFGQMPFGFDDADIDAPEAWNVTTGSESTIVAVIDTGVDYNHPDLAANIWTNDDPINGVDDDGNGFVDDLHGYDFANRDSNPMDDHFHGTHVAGTIGAVGNNGIGVVGVNWHVQIMAVKFLDANGGGFESDAIAALNYAVANGAHISNNSWGGLGFSGAFQAALQSAANAGHIFVAAAGNDGWNNDLDPFYPAGYNVSNVVSVAATDYTDQLAWFSNYGVQSVDLAAPGVDILSTFPTTMTGAMRDGGYSTNYESISGTSMATPHVAGVMALVRSLHADDGWTHQQIINKVLSSVDFIEGASLTVTGGRLNAAAAVDAPDSNGPRIVSTDPSNTAAGTIDHVRLRFSETIDPASIGVDDVLSFSGPDGPIEVLSVVPVASSDRQFDVTFAPQSTLGEYSLVVGPNISDLFGNLLDQDRNGTGGEDPGDVFTATFEIADNVDLDSTDVPKKIDVLDYLIFQQPVTSVLNVSQNIEITDLNLQLFITYFDVEELQIYLESPSGTRVFLVREFDAFGDSFYNTAFDDEASTPIGFGTAPYVGTFRPTQALSNFDGENAAGTWTLYIEAHLGNFLNGEGWLEAWSLQIEGEGGDPPPPPPPPPPPGNRAPVAVDDSLSGEVNSRVAVPAAELLANDIDPDGDQLSISFVGNPVGGSVAVGADQLVTFTPDPDFEGEASFQYIVTDGFAIDTGNVTIQFAPLFQWHNAQNSNDVDKDGQITANDALTIINLLNAFGPSGLYFLSSDAEPEYFLDVLPDNEVTAGDALEVINYLNAFGATSSTMAQAEGESSTEEIDLALLSLLAADNPKKSRA